MMILTARLVGRCLVGLSLGPWYNKLENLQILLRTLRQEVPLIYHQANV
jgi:hypothetical protein